MSKPLAPAAWQYLEAARAFYSSAKHCQHGPKSAANHLCMAADMARRAAAEMEAAACELETGK